MGSGKIWDQWVKGSDFMRTAGEGFNWAGLMSDLWLGPTRDVEIS